MEKNYKVKPKTATDRAEHTVCTADNKTLQEKLMSTPVTLEKSPEGESSPNNHEVRGPTMKYVSASEVEEKWKKASWGTPNRRYKKSSLRMKIMTSAATIKELASRSMLLWTRKIRELTKNSSSCLTTEQIR